MTKGVCWSEKYDSRSWAEHWSCQEQWTGLEVIPAAVLGFYVGFGGGSLVGEWNNCDRSSTFSGFYVGYGGGSLVGKWNNCDRSTFLALFSIPGYVPQALLPASS